MKRILVVDDSAFSRRTICRILDEIPGVEVAGYAIDGEDAMRKALELKPDLVTLDIEMPRMDGFTFLRLLLSKVTVPVLVVSARGNAEQVLRALELGAVDFIVKPSDQQELAAIRHELEEKLSAVFNLKRRPLARIKQAVPAVPVASLPRSQRVMEVVAVGASTGGPPALQSIITALPQEFPAPIVIAQHMPPNFTRAFAERLNRIAPFDICEAAEGDAVEPGRILIAPGGKNLLVRRSGGKLVAAVADPSPGDRYLPSVDVLFASCAEAAGRGVLAVVLTGMGNDGSRGVRAVKEQGGQVLAEAEESAVVFGMPREAAATGAVDRVVRLEAMSREILLRAGNSCR